MVRVKCGYIIQACGTSMEAFSCLGRQRGKPFPVGIYSKKTLAKSTCMIYTSNNHERKEMSHTLYTKKTKLHTPNVVNLLGDIFDCVFRWFP